MQVRGVQLAIMLIACLVGLAQLTSPAEIVANLHTIIHRDALFQYTIYAIEPTVMFRSGMTPEGLKEHFDVRREVRTSNRYPQRLKSLQEALKKTRFEGSAPSIDARFGILIKEGSGKEAVYICTDRYGRVASVDGHYYLMKGDLGPWMSKVGKEMLKSP